jgi:alanine dehydrogenase
MRVLLVNQAEVERLLPMTACIERVAGALADLARGDAALPLRQILWKPDRSGALGLMPGTLPSAGVLGMKAISVFPGNHGTPLDSHQGVVLLFDDGDGKLLAVLDATAITAIRTAAASAVATRELARKEAAVLALIGSGVQARSHLPAMLAVRPFAEIRVWSRDANQARRFAAWGERQHGRPVHVAPSGEEAVRGADVICTVTGSSEPVLRGDWLTAGAHVNAVGACTPNARELDTSAVARARLYTDRRESLLHEAGDVLIPIREGAITEAHLMGELGEVLIGRVPGRASDREITLFKSLGIAIEDLAAAREILDRAGSEGGGTWVELGGERPPDP